jgi:hypothetical protein
MHIALKQVLAVARGFDAVGLVFDRRVAERSLRLFARGRTAVPLARTGAGQLFSSSAAVALPARHAAIAAMIAVDSVLCRARREWIFSGPVHASLRL